MMENVDSPHFSVVSVEKHFLHKLGQILFQVTSERITKIVLATVLRYRGHLRVRQRQMVAVKQKRTAA